MKRHRSLVRRVVLAKSLTGPFRTKDFSVVVFAIIALLGVNGAFVFGFTSRMELGLKSLIDGEFLLSVTYPFIIFAAGSVVYLKLIFIIGELNDRQKITPGGWLPKATKNIPRPLRILMIFCLLVSAYWIVAFPLLEFTAFLLFVISVSQLLLFIIVVFRFDPIEGKQFQLNESPFIFFSYIKNSMKLDSYIGRPSLIGFNATVVLLVSVTIGAARFNSLMSNASYCIKTTDGVATGALIAQSSDYIFLGSSSTKISYLGIFNRYGATLIPKKNIVQIKTTECETAMVQSDFG